MARGRVLLVEDEVMLHLLWEDICADNDVALIGPAITNFEAESLIKNEGDDIACVFLDVNLRGESSAGAAKLLAGLNIPVIVCSGRDGDELPEIFQQWPTLQKPYRLCEVENYLNKLLV